MKDQPVVVKTVPTLGLSTIGIITGIILCILKACGTLTISWFWATFPFWICPAIGLGIFVIVLIVALIYALVG